MKEFHIQTSQQLASHLRSLRKSAGLTQAQLGQRLGVEQARVAKIERNPGSVSAQQLLEVLNALGASLFIRRKAPDPDETTRPPASW